jgi:hypothetical protein
MNSQRTGDRRMSILPIAGLALFAMIAGSSPVGAKNSREEFGELRTRRTPMLAIVSVGDQRVTIYNADGKMLQAPVSTGATGLETPAGIYSVVQKEMDHHSNVYEDGAMPFMQRITWTGIALHGGALPGYPASHGCVRMPQSFAQRLFDLTDVGMRVIVVRDDIAPRDIDHPNLFKPRPLRGEHASATSTVDRLSAALATRPGTATSADGALPSPGSAKHMQLLKSIANAKSTAADVAAKRAGQAKQVAAKKVAEAAPAAKMLVAAQARNAKAEELLKVAEHGLQTANSPETLKQRELAKQKAVAKVAETAAEVQAANLQAQVKSDAAARAAEYLKTAEEAKETAVESANEAARDTQPVSVFISRKTQRLYIRQANLPVFEGPVTIRDADRPLGTYVFTALNYLNDGAAVRWSVVSMYRSGAGAEPAAQGPRGRTGVRNAAAASADVAAAKAALDRIAIAPGVVERISKIVLPGSSLIVSDEGASIETGKDTDFVVLMSGEPQGGIKSRRRDPATRYRDDDDYFGRQPYRGFSFFSD